MRPRAAKRRKLAIALAHLASECSAVRDPEKSGWAGGTLMLATRLPLFAFTRAACMRMHRVRHASASAALLT